jgi:single-strand DNA-binding protein
MDQGKVFVVGRLSRDPDFFGEGEKQRAIFSIAYNRGTGEKRKSNFLDCIAWGKRADIMRDYTKGVGIFVTGDIEQDTYTTKDGDKRNRIQVNVSSITPVAKRERTEEFEGNNSSEVRVGADEDSVDIPF